MRGTSLTTLALALSIGACGSPPEAADENASSNDVAGLTVKALEVRSGPGGARNLSGRFEIREARNNETYVANAAATGGACLVAQVPVEPKSCTADSQCRIAGVGSYSYCLQGTCWVKPKPEICLKGVGKGVHETPTAVPSDIYAYLGSETRPVAWRVLGRLNGSPVDPQHSPCTTEATFMHDCGNPRKVP